MALVFKRILLVTYNVRFSIDIKRSLELVGEYAVTTVRDADTALERLRDQRHNLVILDIENLSVLPTEMIAMIRMSQNDIAIILAPDVPDAHDIALSTDVQGVIDIPITTRQIIPIIENAVRDIFDNLPDTAKAPAVDLPQETVFIETLVDNLLNNDETPYFTSRQIRAENYNILDIRDDDGQMSETNSIEFLIQSLSDGEINYTMQDTDDRSLQLFQRLANEEPPMPGIQDSGTVSDLVRSATRSQLLEMLRGGDEDETEVQSAQLDDEASRSQPAILVLQAALDETTPVRAISVDKLLENIQNRLPEDKQNIRPLPSWLKESKKFVTEPIFLKDELPSLDSQQPIEYTSTLTKPSDTSFVVNDPSNLETEVIQSGVYAVDDVEEVIDISELDDEQDSVDDVIVEDEFVRDDVEVESTDQESVEDIADLDETLIESGESTQLESVEDLSEAEDPYITQLAVTLTQVTTELAAEATILTRDNDIIAYSGEMPIEDIEAIRGEINDDWSATSEDSRIRFITLESSGRDYMLYSKATVGGFTLSMLFAGTKQLRVIRRQGERLIGALDAIPDGSTEVEALPQISAGLVDTPDVIETPTPEPEVIDIPDVIETSIPEPEVVDIPDEEESSELFRPVPTFDDEPIEEERVDVGPKEPFTFIWMVESFEIQLAEHVAQQLVFWLEVQLNSLYWTLHKLEVHQDFIYLYADIPGDLSPSELIRNLMERSEKIVKSEDETLPEKLWADAYLVLTPGREMTDREIQRFLNFGRGEL